MEYALIYISSFHKLIFVIVNNCLGVGSCIIKKKTQKKVLNALLHVMDSFNELENYFLWLYIKNISVISSVNYIWKAFACSILTIYSTFCSFQSSWVCTWHVSCAHYEIFFLCLFLFSTFMSFRLYIFNYFTKCYGKLNFSRAQHTAQLMRSYSK